MAMCKIDDKYVGACKTDYQIEVSEPTKTTCAEEEIPQEELLNHMSYSRFRRAKENAIAAINHEFIRKATKSGETEKKFEGYLVGWLMQREIGWEDRVLYDETLASEIINKSLYWFTREVKLGRFTPMDTCSCNKERSKVKKQYWRIKLALILLGNIDNKDDLALLRRHSGFFGLNIDPRKVAQSRKAVIYNVLKILETRAEAYNDADLLAEIYFKIGIHHNERGEFAKAKTYFEKARAKARYIIGNIHSYTAHYIDTRVDTVVDKATGRLKLDYYPVAEKYRVLSNAYKMLAQTTLLMPRDGREIPLDELRESLGQLQRSQSYIMRRPFQSEYTDNRRSTARGKKKTKGPIYSYFGDVNSLIDLERLRADILGRMGMILMDSCPEQSEQLFVKSHEVLDSIIGWATQFHTDRTATNQRISKGRVRLKLHPNVSGKGIAVFSDWGADIIGNVYLAKARLFMAARPTIDEKLRQYFPPIDDYKAKVREARGLLVEARRYLFRSDEVNFMSGWAEYMVLMNLDSTPPLTEEINAAWGTFYGQVTTDLMPAEQTLRQWHDHLKKKEVEFSFKVAQQIYEVFMAREILENLPHGFVYSRLWLPRIYMKEEKFEKAFAFAQELFTIDPAKPSRYDSPYQAVITAKLKSSIYQLHAELALEEDDLIQAEKYLNVSICWNPYNFYTQLGLADLANWRGEYDKAEKRYKKVASCQRTGVNVRRRVKLSQAEVTLRRKTLNPGLDARAEAKGVIDLAREILKKSQELYMLERSLSSLTEAVVAKRRAGRRDLEMLRSNLLDTDFSLAAYLGGPVALEKAQLRDRVRADLYLKIADGFLFVYKYEEAQQIVTAFEAKDFSKAMEKRKVIMGHWLLTRAEISLRLGQFYEGTRSEILAALETAKQETLQAAEIIFTLEEAKRDPYLSARAVRDLIDIYVDEDNFAKALALIAAARWQKDQMAIGNHKENVLGELRKYNTRVLKPEGYTTARDSAFAVLHDLSLEDIFKQKGLALKWGLLDQDFRLKYAEILIYTKNFARAQPQLEGLQDEITDPDSDLPAEFRRTRYLQLARIDNGLGNIEGQWVRGIIRNEDFRRALVHYNRAERTIEKLEEFDRSQEQILVTSELYVNKAGVYAHGWDSKDIDKSIEYYGYARKIVGEIKANQDLKHYYLARIAFGRTKIAEEKGSLELAGRELWPEDLFDETKSWAYAIIRQYKYAHQQLDAQIDLSADRLARDHEHPRVKAAAASTFMFPSGLSDSAFTDPGRTNELRVSAGLEVPIRFHPTPDSTMEVAPTFTTHIDTNMKSGTARQTFYGGLNFRPTHWLTLGAEVKLEKLDLVMTGDTSIKFMGAPDLKLSASAQLFGNRVNTILATDIYRNTDDCPECAKMTSLYTSLAYSLNRDATNPLVQGLSFGSALFYFRFPYGGNFPIRTKFYPLRVAWEADAKTFDDTDIEGFYHGEIRFRVDAALIYERAVDFSRDGSERFLKDNMGLSLGGTLRLNMPPFTTSFWIGYEGVHQDIHGEYPPPTDGTWLHNVQLRMDMGLLLHGVLNSLIEAFEE
ncbi:tetratricopeptide repeat protein [Candidatus Margulisiibacteriota bacterium]